MGHSDNKNVQWQCWDGIVCPIVFVAIVPFVSMPMAMAMQSLLFTKKSKLHLAVHGVVG